MRIKHNVKGPHEPTQSTMTRTLSPLGKDKHVKTNTEKAAQQMGKKRYQKHEHKKASSARATQNITKKENKPSKKANEHNNVISWECKDVVQTYTAIKFCLFKETKDALNYQMEKKGDTDFNSKTSCEEIKRP